MSLKQFVSVTRNVLLSVIVILGTQSALAEEPDATLSIDAKSIALGVGVTWGDGVLNYQGKEYPIEVSGMSVVDVGAASVSVDGDVYDLKSLDEFEGNYAAASAGIAVAGGAEGSAMKNQNGVVIKVTSTLEGIKVKLAPEGIKIKFAD